jgi:hypothetical protein
MIETVSRAGVGSGTSAARVRTWRSQRPQDAAAAGAFGARRQRHQLRMPQVEGEVGGARIAVARVDFEAVQDDFLEPGRQTGPQGARGGGRHHQPPAPLADGARLAERARARGKEVKDHAERKQVAARIVADEEDLLGRDIGAGAERAVDLFGRQIGQAEVAGKPEIEQHRFAAVTDHDVARLEVEVNDVLPVQVLERVGDARAHIGDLFGRKRQIVQTVPERAARDQFHHQIGIVEIAGRDEGRHVRAGEPRKDDLLGLVADDRQRILARQQERQLHHQRLCVVGMRHLPQGAEPAMVEFLRQPEAADHVAGRELAGHLRCPARCARRACPADALRESCAPPRRHRRPRERK